MIGDLRKYRVNFVVDDVSCPIVKRFLTFHCRTQWNLSLSLQNKASKEFRTVKGIKTQVICIKTQFHCVLDAFFLAVTNHGIFPPHDGPISLSSIATFHFTRFLTIPCVNSSPLLSISVIFRFFPAYGVMKKVFLSPSPQKVFFHDISTGDSPTKGKFSGRNSLRSRFIHWLAPKYIIVKLKTQTNLICWRRFRSREEKTSKAGFPHFVYCLFLELLASIRFLNKYQNVAEKNLNVT